MIIFGVAFLALCTLTGIFVGELLGKAIGVPANVGGVGIAMVLLILIGSYLKKRGLFNPESRAGHQVLERRVHPHRGRHGRAAERLRRPGGRSDGDPRWSRCCRAGLHAGSGTGPDWPKKA